LRRGGVQHGDPNSDRTSYDNDAGRRAESGDSAPASVALTATVSRTGSAAVPTGSVAFYYQTTELGSAKLYGSGVATLTASTASVPAGSYPVTAKYSGDAQDAPSSSQAVTVVVK
jgi:hypothetical protein